MNPGSAAIRLLSARAASASSEHCCAVPPSSAHSHADTARSMLAPIPSARSPVRTASQSRGRIGHGGAEGHAGVELERLERAPLVDGAGRELRDRLAGHRDRLLRRAREQEHPRQHVAGARALERIRQEGVRLAEVLDGRRHVQQRLGHAQLQQQRRALVLGRRLLQGAAQIGDRALRDAAPCRGARRVAEQRGDPGLGAARHHEQVRGHVLRCGAQVDQRLGRALVLQLALGRCELVVDRVAHERMHEPERRIRAQDLGSHERACGLGRARLVELGEDRGRREPGAVAQHRDRPRDRDRAGRQSRQAQQHRPRHRDRGPRSRITSASSAAGSRPSAASVLSSSPSSSGLPRGRAPAGRDEGRFRVRAVAEPRADQLGHARVAQRLRPERDGRRIVRDLLDQPRVGVGLAHPRGRRDEHAQPLEPALEERQEPQRGRVAPVQVVDGEHQRPVRGDVRGEPEQPDEDPVRDVAGRVRLVGRREDAAAPAAPTRPASAPARPARPGSGRTAAARRRTAGRARDRCRARRGPGARPRRPSPARAASRRLLPMPGRPLDEGEHGIARQRIRQQAVERRELLVALDERAPACGRPGDRDGVDVRHDLSSRPGRPPRAGRRPGGAGRRARRTRGSPRRRCPRRGTPHGRSARRGTGPATPRGRGPARRSRRRSPGASTPTRRGPASARSSHRPPSASRR